MPKINNKKITITLDLDSVKATFKKLADKKISMTLFALLLLFNSIGIGFIEYYILKARFEKDLSTLVATEEDPEKFVKRITTQVLPQAGYTTNVSWGEMGEKLVEVGAIDEDLFAEIFTTESNGGDEMKVLSGQDKKISINEKNSRFIVNTLWALGLVNKSKVLDEGPMATGDTPIENYASTGGWTLGAKSAKELYSSEELITLTPEEQELVYAITENIFRPCCGNHSAFPDCNHGMAVLGYVQMAVAQGISEDQIYKDVLALNSFWFPTTYIEMAAYFEKEQGTTWDKVDAKTALSYDYSSALGAQEISQKISGIPGFESKGGSCGA